MHFKQQYFDGELKVDYMTLGIASILTYNFTLKMIQQTDELTELLNRRGYENCISHIDEKCVVVFFNVDKFKKANDTRGHAFGDNVLKKGRNSDKKVIFKALHRENKKVAVSAR